MPSVTGGASGPLKAKSAIARSFMAAGCCWTRRAGGARLQSGRRLGGAAAKAAGGAGPCRDGAPAGVRAALLLPLLRRGARGARRAGATHRPPCQDCRREACELVRSEALGLQRGLLDGRAGGWLVEVRTKKRVVWRFDGFVEYERLVCERGGSLRHPGAWTGGAPSSMPIPPLPRHPRGPQTRAAPL
jgi:hypothetical protein